jgi:hypothetical protein
MMMLPNPQAPMVTGAMFCGAANKVGALRSTFVAHPSRPAGIGAMWIKFQNDVLSAP